MRCFPLLPQADSLPHFFMTPIPVCLSPHLTNELANDRNKTGSGEEEAEGGVGEELQKKFLCPWGWTRTKSSNLARECFSRQTILDFLN